MSVDSSEASVTPTKAAPTVTPATTPSKESDEAMNELVQGKRHLLVKDYASAVISLGKACELLGVKFGETAPECGDAYLAYGKALLELARTESGVLEMNESEKGEGSDDEEEEGEDEENEEENKEEDKEDSEENPKSKEVVNGTSKDVNGANNEVSGTGEDLNDISKDANGTEENSGNEDKENEKAPEEGEAKDEEDDVNNLQLSWEMLELAKVIFERQLERGDDKQVSLKLAEVYLKLGEVGVESENYDTAVEDMKICLNIQKDNLDEDDRRVAETYYNLGMAHSLKNDFDAAIESFTEASKQLERRIATLEKTTTETPNKDGENDAFYTVEGEIAELKALLPEMKEKISDMRDFKRETMQRVMASLQEESAKRSSVSDGAGPSTASEKPVSSVAHLIKRKPKTDDDTQAADGNERKRKSDSEEAIEESAKKSKIEEAVSGSS